MHAPGTSWTTYGRGRHMKDYISPRTNAQVLAAKRSELRDFHRMMVIPNECVWPECTRKTWTELQLPLCHKHAARTHLKVADVIPAENSRVHQASDPEGWWTKPGYVYFAESQGMIKIGFSTDVNSRMASLGSQSGHVHILLAKFPGNRRDEKRIHFEFGEYWIEGEYFSNAPRLMTHVRKIRAEVDAA